MIRSFFGYLNTRKVWNISFWTFVGAVILVSGRPPIDAVLAANHGFFSAYLRSIYDGFSTYVGWPVLVTAGVGAAAGKPPLPKS